MIVGCTFYGIYSASQSMGKFARNLLKRSQPGVQSSMQGFSRLPRTHANESGRWRWFHIPNPSLLLTRTDLYLYSSNLAGARFHSSACKSRIEFLFIASYETRSRRRSYEGTPRPFWGREVFATQFYPLIESLGRYRAVYAV